ncbi:MAG: hypothetical protein QM570_11095 [Planctomycetota bacterium]|nr:hypothetical protein [Planctomycetota bacterium]
MGKVTGTINASIYLVLDGMVLAAGFEAWTLTWALWGLAALMLVVLCVFGYRLDALVGESAPTVSKSQRLDQGAARPFRREHSDDVRWAA